MKKCLIVLTLVLSVFAGILGCSNSKTKIPKLYFEGNMEAMEIKSDERMVAFTYEDGKNQLSGNAMIKVQGSSSLQYPKKNYTVNFYTDGRYAEKLAVDVGWGAQSKYCLKANWIDKTHARNVVTAKLAGQMQEAYGLLNDTPNHGAVDGFPVEIYINGAFHGLYTFNIPKDAWQFGMDKDNPDHIVICGEDWMDAVVFKAMPDYEAWSVEVGEDNERTMEKMNRLFDFVLNSSDEEFRNNFNDYLNLDSALNYYIMCDLAYLRDNLGKNMLLVTYDAEQWYLSLYDLDTSWGAYWNGSKLYSYEKDTVDMDRSNLFVRMEKNFGKELAQRYFELRENILSNEHILQEFREFTAQIPEKTLEMERSRWEGAVEGADSLPGFDLEQIEEYLNTVTPRLEEKYQQMLTK